MKVTLKTEKGSWIVKTQRMTYLFNSSEEAFRFVEICHRAKIN